MKNFILGDKYSKYSFYTDHINDYMSRWIFKTPFGSIRLHHILRSDEDTALHDHPMSFWAFIIKGSYLEILPLQKHNDDFFENSSSTKTIRRRCLSFRWVPAEIPHRIVLNKPVWSIIFAKKPHREWGFYSKKFGKKYWVSSQKYFGERHEKI